MVSVSCVVTASGSVIMAVVNSGVNSGNAIIKKT